MAIVSSTDFLRASERATAIATLNRQRHLTPSCGGSTPTAERTVGPARTIVGELDTQTEPHSARASISSVGQQHWLDQHVTGDRCYAIGRPLARHWQRTGRLIEAMCTMATQARLRSSTARRSTPPRKRNATAQAVEGNLGGFCVYVWQRAARLASGSRPQLLECRTF
jgi:hypothetical protein